jgi:hypothetical protein
VANSVHPILIPLATPLAASVRHGHAFERPLRDGNANSRNARWIQLVDATH